MIQCHRLSLAGPKRRQQSENEDCSGYYTTGRYALGVVCDGVSSSNYGGEAARMGCDSLTESLQQHGDGAMESLQSWLTEALNRANQAIWNRYRGSGTTTVVVALIDTQQQQWLVANAGDSPADVYHDATAKREVITVSHIKAVPYLINGETQIKDGVPLMQYPIVSGFGIDETIPQVSYQQQSYQLGDRLLLRSDGVDEPTCSMVLNEAEQIDTTRLQQLLYKSAQQTNDDTTLLLLTLGFNATKQQFLQQLQQVEQLDMAAKQQLLTALKQHRFNFRERLWQWYQQEPEQSVKIALLPHLHLSREQLLAQADEAAAKGHGQLMRQLIEQVKRC